MSEEDAVDMRDYEKTLIKTSIYPEDSSYKTGRTDERADMIKNGWRLIPSPDTEAYQKLREMSMKETCKHLSCYDKDCEYHGLPRCPYCEIIVDTILSIIREGVK